MSDLVRELKEEHRLIVEAIDNVRKLGVSVEEGRNALLNIREVLIEHLAKEDDLLYPVLKDAAQNDENLKRVLDVFAHEVDDILNIAEEFFAKYSDGDVTIEFAHDVGKIMAALWQRIGSEEQILFEKYEEIMQGK